MQCSTKHRLGAKDVWLFLPKGITRNEQEYAECIRALAHSGQARMQMNSGLNLTHGCPQMPPFGGGGEGCTHKK